MARDSMYRQVYQHRVLQAADALTYNIVARVRDLIEENGAPLSATSSRQTLDALKIFCDDDMLAALLSSHYAESLPLETLFHMTESWWTYHLDRWCFCGDPILTDLAQRLRHRRLFKTVRLDEEGDPAEGGERTAQLLDQLRSIALELGYDPRYYVNIINNSDKHRGKGEEAPLVLMDNGELRPVTQVEPLIAALAARPPLVRKWVAVPQEVKERLGRLR